MNRLHQTFATKIKVIALGTVLGIGTILCGCSNDEHEKAGVEPNERVDITLDYTTRAAAKDLKDFYIGFTTDAVSCAENNADSDNVVVSPLSASMMLAMIANGLDSDLQEEITGYLGVEDLSTLNTLSNILLIQLPTLDNQTDLRLANSLWVNDNYSITKSFSNTLSTDYLAGINFENYGTGALKKKINNWCSTNTDGLIKDIDVELSPSSLALLINAIYFKGLWKKNTFLAENTEKSRFHGISGVGNVDMMHSEHMERYYAVDDDFEWFSLDFGNGSFSFTVVLPNENLSLSEANARLTPEKISKLQMESVRCLLEVYMPKFDAKTKLDLNTVFEIGNLKGFNDSDIIFNMFDPTQKGEIMVKQSACIEVNEKGAKAAAVTTGQFIITALPVTPNQKYTVRVDRPFYFFINERSTGACLLSGRITEP